MMEIRRASQRGHANFGWLDTHHTFSFGHYHDPRYMGFGPLRVINEDRVQPGTGFGAHGHRSMEIISYVVSGALAHRDSTGGGGVIRPGEIQVMTAGRGIRHSEMNGSRTEEVHFLQIWIEPLVRDSDPGYTDRAFPPADGLTLLVSPDGREGSVAIRQDADLWRALLPGGGEAKVALRGTRGWVQVVRGTLDVNGARLFPGDGLAITDTATLALTAATDAVEALVFDLP